MKGELFKDWRWDASYEFGRTKSRTVVKNTRLASFDTQATNAITPPAGYSGTIYRTPWGAPVICASSVANPNDGCLPVDLLGANITPAVLSKYFKDEWQTRKVTQHDLMVNVRGTLFNLPAGPVQAAVGGEFRRDEVSGAVDPLTAAGQFAAPQVTALPQIVQKVTEGYAEANIPLLADLPLVKTLSVDVTGRLTHYSGFGNARPWKVGLEYQPSDQILVRVTRSADIRAPTAAEFEPQHGPDLHPAERSVHGDQPPGRRPGGRQPEPGTGAGQDHDGGRRAEAGFHPGLPRLGGLV
ncbi:TonB-dependent receptor domain-containing protein [Caulobacter sp. UC70_42]|uniref:TonB-dependent receptor domain-containing protein n=1 Tax=Caulobacter sp. UC70_42 TaxID=3374551 RepID=UPI0037567D72